VSAVASPPGDGAFSVVVGVVHGDGGSMMELLVLLTNFGEVFFVVWSVRFVSLRFAIGWDFYLPGFLPLRRWLWIGAAASLRSWLLLSLASAGKVAPKLVQRLRFVVGVVRRRCLMRHLPRFGASFRCWLVDLALKLQFLALLFVLLPSVVMVAGGGRDRSLRRMEDLGVCSTYFMSLSGAFVYLGFVLCSSVQYNPIPFAKKKGAVNLLAKCTYEMLH